jgi:homogentisate 1,2-dioxygenase
MQLRALWRAAVGHRLHRAQHQNERTWCYRIRPSVKHTHRFQKIDVPHWKSAPHVAPDIISLGQYRWDPVPHAEEPLTWITGMRTMTTAGDVNTQAGHGEPYLSGHRLDGGRIFLLGRRRILVVPQEGRLRFCTELGMIDLEPKEIAILPRGLVYRVEVLEGPARGFVCENYGQKFHCPAAARSGPTAWRTARLQDPGGGLRGPRRALDRDGEMVRPVPRDADRPQPLDVVAWHGNYAPCKYDLRTYCPVGAILFDHPDPSIFTVLTAPSGIEGTANIDFVLFRERWMVAENTFRPPWYHKNVMSELMGNIYGIYDAKPKGFVPGGMSLHNCMLPHGPDRNAFEGLERADGAGQAGRDDVLHVRDPLPAAPDGICREGGASAGRLHRLLGVWRRSSTGRRASSDDRRTGGTAPGPPGIFGEQKMKEADAA